MLVLLDAYPNGGRFSHEELAARDEQDMLTTLIRLVDYDAKILEGEPLTFAEAMGFLRGQGNALAGLREDQFSAIREVLANNCRLALDFTPGQFCGDLLLFAATIEQPENAPTPDVWRPYVDGRIETHVVACGHDHMMKSSGPLAEIGPILAAKLRLMERGTDEYNELQD